MERAADALPILLNRPETELNGGEEKWTWKKIEAALDSGAVDHVIDPSQVPGYDLLQTDDSKAGKSWTGPSGEPIPKLGAIRLPWYNSDGRERLINFQAGKVGRALLSASRLEDAGFETRLSKKGRSLVNLVTGERFELRRSGGLYMLDMWCKVKETSFRGPAKA